MSNAPSLSPEMEDYLEAIAWLIHVYGEARVTDIAERLGVRKASVTLALRTLAKKKLVRYQPYVTPTLTRTGAKIANRVQHRHDVIRRFLIDILQIDPETADANACRLEHAMDSEVLGHLADFLLFLQRHPDKTAEWIQEHQRAHEAEEESQNA